MEYIRRFCCLKVVTGLTPFVLSELLSASIRTLRSSTYTHVFSPGSMTKPRQYCFHSLTQCGPHIWSLPCDIMQTLSNSVFKKLASYLHLLSVLRTTTARFLDPVCMYVCVCGCNYAHKHVYVYVYSHVM